MEEENIFGIIREGSIGNGDPREVTEEEFRQRLNRFLQTGYEFLALAGYLSYDDYQSFQLYLDELEKAGIHYGKIAFVFDTGTETDRCGINVFENVRRHYVELDDIEGIDQVFFENQKLRKRVDIVSLSLAEDWAVIDKSRFSKKLLNIWRDRSDLLENISIDTENWKFGYTEGKV